MRRILSLFYWVYSLGDLQDPSHPTEHLRPSSLPLSHNLTLGTLTQMDGIKKLESASILHPWEVISFHKGWTPKTGQRLRFGYTDTLAYSMNLCSSHHQDIIVHICLPDGYYEKIMCPLWWKKEQEEWHKTGPTKHASSLEVTGNCEHRAALVTWVLCFVLFCFSLSQFPWTCLNLV